MVEDQWGNNAQCCSSQASPITSETVLDLLKKGDSKELAARIVNQQVLGVSLCSLLDNAIAPAMWAIGRMWEAGELDISQEHLCSQTLRDALAVVGSHLTAKINQPEPVAIGCCCGTEYHDLASMMIALVLRESGYDAKSLGGILPVANLLRAIDNFKPDLIWVSYSVIRDEAVVIRENATVFEHLLPHQKLVIGGQALTGKLRRQLKFHFTGDCLEHLQRYVESIART